MKSIFVFVNFYFLINFTSAIQALNQKVNNGSTLYHSASHLQGLEYQQHGHLNNRNNGVNPLNPSHFQEGPYQHQAHSHNDVILHQQATAINGKNNQLNQQRGRFQSRHYLPTAAATRKQVNPFNNLEIHPKFRPLFQSRGNNKFQFPPRSNVNDQVKPSGIQTRRRVSFGDYFYQQKIRSLFGHYHHAVPSFTHSHAKIGLKR